MSEELQVTIDALLDFPVMDLPGQFRGRSKTETETVKIGNRHVSIVVRNISEDFAVILRGFLRDPNITVSDDSTSVSTLKQAIIQRMLTLANPEETSPEEPGHTRGGGIKQAAAETPLTDSETFVLIGEEKDRDAFRQRNRLLMEESQDSDDPDEQKDVEGWTLELRILDELEIRGKISVATMRKISEEMNIPHDRIDTEIRLAVDDFTDPNAPLIEVQQNDNDLHASVSNAQISGADPTQVGIGGLPLKADDGIADEEPIALEPMPPISDDHVVEKVPPEVPASPSSVPPESPAVGGIPAPPPPVTAMAEPTKAERTMLPGSLTLREGQAEATRQRIVVLEKEKREVEQTMTVGNTRYAEIVMEIEILRSITSIGWTDRQRIEDDDYVATANKFARLNRSAVNAMLDDIIQRLKSESILVEAE